MNAKTTVATTAVALLAAGFFAASAEAAPAPQPGPGGLSADSPTSMSYTGMGKAKVTDANGIRRVVQYKDQFHATTTYSSNACVTSLSVSQHYPIDGQKFKVVDCSGNERTFAFQVNG
ncbi:MAG: hypothetical protein ACT4QF_14865 [Sporichthyaceae bacterium]